MKAEYNENDTDNEMYSLNLCHTHMDFVLKLFKQNHFIFLDEIMCKYLFTAVRYRAILLSNSSL